MSAHTQKKKNTHYYVYSNTTILNKFDSTIAIHWAVIPLIELLLLLTPFSHALHLNHVISQLLFMWRPYLLHYHLTDYLGQSKPAFFCVWVLQYLVNV